MSATGPPCPAGGPAMRAARLALAVVVAFGVAALAPADEPKEKTPAEQLTGTWEWQKGTMPAGSSLELAKDGKFTLTKKQDGKDVFSASGTWAADAVSLKLSGKVGDRDVTTPLTITK